MLQHKFYYLFLLTFIFSNPANLLWAQNYAGNQRAFYEDCTSNFQNQLVFNCECLADQYPRVNEQLKIRKRDEREKRLERSRKTNLGIVSRACSRDLQLYFWASLWRQYPENPSSTLQERAKKFGGPRSACALLEEVNAGQDILPKAVNSTDSTNALDIPDARVDEAWMVLGEDLSCRNEEKIYAHYYEEAQQKFNSNGIFKPNTTRPEAEFCDCYASVFTKGIMTTPNLGSRLYVQLGTEAQQQCK